LLVAPVSRAYLSLNGVSPEFGFDQTATHLRMEGLLLGFWLSFLSVNKFEAWSIVVRLSSWVIAGSVLVLIVTQFTNAGWMYRVGYSAMALGLAGLLVFMIGRKAGIVARWPCVKAIALASYSVYLTHPLMIHLSNILMAKIPGISLFFYFPLVIMMIIIGGAVFYLSVERNAIILRDRWVPRRVLATKVNS